jgi:hypothetical protein
LSLSERQLAAILHAMGSLHPASVLDAARGVEFVSFVHSVLESGSMTYALVDKILALLSKARPSQELVSLPFLQSLYLQRRYRPAQASSDAPPFRYSYSAVTRSREVDIPASTEISELYESGLPLNLHIFAHPAGVAIFDEPGCPARAEVEEALGPGAVPCCLEGNACHFVTPGEAGLLLTRFRDSRVEEDSLPLPEGFSFVMGAPGVHHGLVLLRSGEEYRLGHVMVEESPVSVRSWPVRLEGHPVRLHGDTDDDHFVVTFSDSVSTWIYRVVSDAIVGEHFGLSAFCPRFLCAVSRTPTYFTDRFVFTGPSFSRQTAVALALPALLTDPALAPLIVEWGAVCAREPPEPRVSDSLFAAELAARLRRRRRPRRPRRGSHGGGLRRGVRAAGGGADRPAAEKVPGDTLWAAPGASAGGDPAWAAGAVVWAAAAAGGGGFCGAEVAALALAGRLPRGGLQDDCGGEF